MQPIFNKDEKKIIRASIVICTRNRANMLAITLDHFQRLKANAPWELIVIDNGSTDNTQDVLDSTLNSELPIKSFICTKPGSGAARDHGWRVASGDYIIYTDDDCYPSADLLNTYLNLFSEYPSVDFFSGSIHLWDESDAKVTVDYRKEIVFYPPFQFPKPGEWQCANMAIKRSSLEKIGGFDSNLGAGTIFPCEDVEVVARGLLKGCTGLFHPAPLVYHHHQRKASDIPRLLAHYANGRGAYYARFILDRSTRNIASVTWRRKLLDSIFSSIRRREFSYVHESWLEFKSGLRYLNSGAFARRPLPPGRFHEPENSTNSPYKFNVEFNPLLSVLIPSFNCEKFLTRAIESAIFAFTQTSEVIVIDDGSTDQTALLCAKLKEAHTNLRVIHQPNGGLSAARNAGIRAARGKFIVLLDSDDELVPIDPAVIADFDGDMIRVGIEEVDDENKSLRTESSGAWTGKQYLIDRLSQRTFYTPSWAYIYRREWLIQEDIKFLPGIIHEDNLFTIQALLAAKKLKVVPDVLYRYIRRDGSITRESDPRKLERRIHSLKIIVAQLTALANKNPDVDIRLWIDYVVHSAAVLSRKIDSTNLRFKTIWIQIRFMLCYRGYQAPALHIDNWRRLKYLILGFK